LRKWRGTNYRMGSAHKCKTKNQNAAIIHSAHPVLDVGYPGSPFRARMS
jgi:hypothetical protein